MTKDSDEVVQTGEHTLNLTDKYMRFDVFFLDMTDKEAEIVYRDIQTAIEMVKNTYRSFFLK